MLTQRQHLRGGGSTWLQIAHVWWFVSAMTSAGSAKAGSSSCSSGGYGGNVAAGVPVTADF